MSKPLIQNQTVNTDEKAELKVAVHELIAELESINE